MSKTIALIGRANVGKSTLFNLLCNTNKAIVADLKGTTRDRQYGIAKRYFKYNFNLVDTGGITGLDDEINLKTENQANIALNEAEIIFFIVDGREGVTLGDESIAKKLRQMKNSKAIYLLVNKCDGINIDQAKAEFYQLGLTEPIAISATTRMAVRQLAETLDKQIDQKKVNQTISPISDATKVAIIGKPNGGKSTLINQLLGQERLITSDIAGTSRDSIEVVIEFEKQSYCLIDTAGIRRRSKVKEPLEKLTIIKAMQSMQIADVVVFVLDAKEKIATSQDMRLIELIIEANRPLIIALNKCDGMSQIEMKEVKKELMGQISFLDWAEFHFIAAVNGFGLSQLMKKVKKLSQKSSIELSTSKLTETLNQLIAAHPAPKIHSKRVKFRYAHQGGKNPPIIVLHGNHNQSLAQNYQNYLLSGFRKAFDLAGIPIVLQFRKSDNPYKNKKNQLTQRQITKKKRLIRFVKSKK